MKYKRCSIYKANSKEVIFSEVLMPNDFFSRAKGLLGRPEIGDSEGLLFLKCNSIHMLGMRFPIDLIFLNSLGEIIRCVRSLKPWRIAASLGSSVTLEVKQGSINKHQLQPGIQLGWEFR